MQRLFCVSEPVALEAIDKRVKLIMKKPAEERSNEDLNILLTFFLKQQFFEQIKVRKSLTNLMLIISALRFLEFPKNAISIDDRMIHIDSVASAKYVYVISGSVTLSNPSDKQRFSEGSHFDEKDLELATTVTSRHGCELVVVMQRDFNQSMDFNWRQLRKMIEILKQFEEMRQMRYQHLQFLAQHAALQTYEFKQVVCQAGDEAGFWYGIVKGQFVFRKQIPNGSFNTMNKLQNAGSSLIEAGQSFGESEILLRCRRKSAVVCMSNENQIVKIPSAVYELVLKEYPKKSEVLTRSVEARNEWKETFELKVEQTMKNYSKIMKKIASAKQGKRLLPALSAPKETDIDKINIQTNHSYTLKLGKSGYHLHSRISTLREHTEEEARDDNLPGTIETLSKRARNVVSQQSPENLEHNNVVHKEIQMDNQMQQALPKEKIGRGLIGADSYTSEKVVLLERIKSKSEEEGMLMPIELGKFQRLKAMKAVPIQKKNQPMNRGGKMLSLLREKAINRLLKGSPRKEEVLTPSIEKPYLIVPSLRPESMLETTNKFDEIFFKRL